MKTITGREINVTANHSARTFTIRTNGSKYRTIQLSKDEFQSCLNNSGQDWAEFLKGSDYFKVS
jgi:siroheme synthase (precorrin-2 oxidase/ferrochelatase)